MGVNEFWEIDSSSIYTQKSVFRKNNKYHIAKLLRFA